MTFDVLIKGGQVISGEKDARPTRLDVGIDSDRIVALGPLEGASAKRVIDAYGKIVSPGFIDVHVHSEVALLGGPHRYAELLQGVTTQLSAPDGFGWAPLSAEAAKALWDTLYFSVGQPLPKLGFPTAEAYLDLFTGNLPANLVPQVPHCAIRVGTVGWAPRGPTKEELTCMRRLVAKWMEAGATSLCLGLDYQPSAFATTEELVELAKVARAYEGIYAAHIRYNSLGREGAWQEALEIARRADIAVHVSHEYIDDLSEAMLAAGEDLSFEAYLYPASCTHLSTLLPVWAQAGGAPGLRERLKDWAFRYEMQKYLENYFSESVARAERAVFAATASGRYIRKSFDEAAREEGLTLGAFGVKVLTEEYPYALMIYHRGVSETDWQETISRTINHPAMMVASDGVYTGAHAHPRGYGCFARVLRLCVRELGAISLPEAIYKMSGFPAERFRIKDRGFVRRGLAADLVIFDPETVADRATWDQPRREPVGIDVVMVNGVVVCEQGKPTGALPGRVIR